MTHSWLGSTLARDLGVSKLLRRAGLVCVAVLASLLSTSTTTAAEPDAPAAPKPVAVALAPENPFPRRVKSPGLEGGIGWINTSGPLELEQLKGKFVLLDFWTYCCINCMHVLPELKKLEHKYPNELVVIGVHSAKFEGEADSQNITEAVMRYEIQHPVVNDAKHAIWNRFGVNSWPTILLIDPEGYAIWGRSGESSFETIDAVLAKAVTYYRRRGVIDATPLRFDLAAAKAPATPLRYPGKVLADEASGRLFVADSNHNRVVVAKLDGTLIDVIGSGREGKADGDFATAEFNHPQGMALKGETLYVADTENHTLRKIDLQAKQVKTIAGKGVQARNSWPGLNIEDGQAPNPSSPLPRRFVGKPDRTALNSPWDLLIHEDELYIAMAGPHQIWKMPLDEHEIGPFAGNGREDIVDGPHLPRVPYEEGYSSFAQPSGLSSDGTLLYVADSEGSSIRGVPFDTQKKVITLIGTSNLESGRLFTFGDIDGPGDNARLQHALGVAWMDGLIYVADTYNNKIKVINVKQDTVRTIAGSGKPGLADGETDQPRTATFDEPAGISSAGGKLYIADTNNHAIRVVEPAAGGRVSTLTISGLTPPKPAEPEQPAIPGVTHKLPAATVRTVDGKVQLHVSIKLPTGWKLNQEAPMRYNVVGHEGKLIDAAALGKPTKVDPPATDFAIQLPAQAAGHDRLRITLQYFYCQEQAAGLCKAGTAVWEVSVTTADSAQATQVPLPLKVE